MADESGSPQMPTAPQSHHFPFSAVVGSDNMALALILTTISPAVGGVLVRGEKGTAKSTMVRALASVLPPIEVIAGDRFSTRSEEHTSDLQSLMRSSYAVFCLKKTTIYRHHQ